MSDTTEPKQTEETLRQSEERFRSLSACSPVGIFMADVEGRCTYTNSRCQIICGFTFEEALGEGYAKSIHPDDREWVFAEWMAFATAGREYYAEYRFQTKEGIVRWVHARTAPMLSDQGELIGHVGTIEDITVAKYLETERKQAAEALRLRNQELLTLHKISEITLGAQSLKSAFQEIVEETSASTGFPIIAIELYDEARQIMVFAGVKGVPLPADESVLEVPVDETLSGTVARTGQAIVKIYSSQESKQCDANEALCQLGIQTFICVPMIANQRVIGVLSLAHPEAVEVDEHLPQWIASLAGFIASLTERKRAEETLRESEEQYRVLAEALPQFVWSSGTDGAVEYCNRHWLEYTGLTLEQSTGPGWISVLHPDDVQRTLDRWNRAKKRGESYEIEYRFKQASDGIYRWYFARISPVQGPDGQITKWIGAATEIDARKQAEEALQLSQSRLALIYSSVSDWIFLISVEPDECYRCLSVNQSYLQNTGLTEAQVIGKKIEEILPEPTAAAYGKTKCKQAIQAAQPIQYEESVDLPKGHKTLDITLTPIFDANRNCTHLLGVAHDITERKKIEQAQARLTAILEATTDLVSMADMNGHILYFNKAARKMLGLNETEDISQKQIAPGHPEWAAALVFNEGIPAAIRDGVWQGETAVLRYDGQEVPISQVILAHRATDGNVEYLSTIARDISERKSLEAQLAYLGNHDPLTGLFNRRHFQSELERQLALAQRYNTQGGLLFLDLDDFKDVNDSLGHLAGDELLKQLAILLQLQLRQTDILARLGGDEFAVLLPQTDAEQVQFVAERILAALADHVVTVSGQTIRVTVSIGIALFPEHGTVADELLAHADVAMYQSKGKGHHGFCLYTPDPNWRSQSESRQSWKNRIREALERDLFVLHCQPILNLVTNQVSQHELLLRMVGEGAELISPDLFLPIAEHSGLIYDIDRWVVCQAIQLIADHQRLGLELYLEVNLSSKSLSDSKLLPLIQQQLALTGINPTCLILEITETAAIANINQARTFISTLKQLGCQFALDDFGKGYSSFAHLKHLPVDFLKIDGTFIQNLLSDPVDRQLVKAIVEVACGLHKQTVAEFVSNEETIQLLRELGVNYAQGYHVGRPSAVSERLPKFTDG